MLYLEPSTFCLKDSEPAEPSQESAIGRYKLERRLGEGGMGVVYEARAESTGRRVALKVPRQGNLDAGEVDLRREAETLAGLRHPSIARFHDLGRSSEGQSYFTMELVRGVDLTVWRRRLQRPLSQEELDRQIFLFRRICQAVAYAHRNGVAHLDLKPANILVEKTANEENQAKASSASRQPRTPEVKLLDFGLARRLDEPKIVNRDCERRTARGTLAYMSPEQARGESEALGARSDVYALGAICTEMLTGQLPITPKTGDREEALRALSQESPKRLGNLDRRLRGDLEAIVAKALAKDPAGRYATAGRLLADLDRFLAQRPVRARRSAWHPSRWLPKPETAYRWMWCTLVSCFTFTLLLSLASRFGWWS